MKKIIVFTPSLDIGGKEKVLLTYAKGLLECEADVKLLLCIDNGDFSYQLPKKLNVVSLGVSRLRQSLFKLIAFLCKEKPQYILVANSATIFVWLSKLLSFSRVKIIASHHNYLNSETTAFFERHILWTIYNRCYRVISVSHGITKFLQAKGVKFDKIQTIYNPIDIISIHRLASIPFSDVEEKYILFVGRLSVVKNLFFLLDSFAIFSKNVSKVKLIVIGDGPERDNLLQYTYKHHLSNRVVFLGVRSNPYPYIKKAELVVLSSHSEAFPTILLEALSLGKTIVSTPTKGAVEILNDGQYGYLSKSLEDVNSFSSLLIYAYHHRLDSNVLIDYATKSYGLQSRIDLFLQLC